MTKNRTALNGRALRILLLLGENLTWSHARSWPYNLHLGFEEALQANGVEVLVLTTPWISHLAKICAGREFDQVWVIDLTHFCHIDASLEQIVKLAPIRVGLVTESVEYHPEEYEAFPWLRERRARIDAQFQYVTHLAAVDEQDVINIKANFDLPTMWNPCSMPEGLIDEEVPPPSENIAFFSGSIYGKRAKWLEEPKLKDLLTRHKSANADRVYSLFFNTLPSHRWGFSRLVKQPRFPGSLVYPLYLNLLRRIRRSGFIMWQQDVLQKGVAVVNFDPTYPTGMLRHVQIRERSYFLPNVKLHAKQDRTQQNRDGWQAMRGFVARIMDDQLIIIMPFRVLMMPFLFGAYEWRLLPASAQAFSRTSSHHTR